jgi:hypothetical protein
MKRFLQKWTSKLNAIRRAIMEAIMTFLETCRVFLRRFVKGLLLAGWLIILLGLAGWAASGQAVQVFAVEVFQPSVITFAETRFFRDGTGEADTPSEHLEGFLWRFDNPPPIAVILDAAAPNWRDVNVAKKWPEESGIPKSKWVREQYENLFIKANGVVKAYTKNFNIDPRGQDIKVEQVVPPLFRGITWPNLIKIPPEVVAWILDERQRVTEEKNRLSLLKVFLLLIVLGAFGSLIFLTRDFIIRESTTTIAGYVFRPIFGILLALAVFVVDILGHSLISTADILQIRHETLYVLALAAGLLSEQAYNVLLGKASDALNQFQQGSQTPPAARTQQTAQPQPTV